MIHRTLQAVLHKEIHEYRKSILLLGPRQVGKSTLMKHLNPQLTVNLADESTYRAHLNDPAFIRRQVQALAPQSLCLIDEVQRIPSLLNSVQAMMDEPQQWKFLLTGSSARKLKRGQANLLPGRVFSHFLFPLTFWEIGINNFNLDRALIQGSLPEIYLKEYGAQLLKSYIDAYLREEIQAEALIRNLEQYSRFLDLAAETSGEIVNYSKLASDSEIPKETLRRFYDVLEDTLIVHRIPGFTDVKNSRRPMQKEKFLFFDLGVKNAILKQHENHFTDTQKGQLFEQWLFLQLIAFAHYHQKNWTFHYYRDDLHNEVDCVIDIGNSKVIAIEIKYARSFHAKDARGLEAFKKYSKKKVEAYVVYRGEQLQKEGDVWVVPYQKFLTEQILEE